MTLMTFKVMFTIIHFMLKIDVKTKNVIFSQFISYYIYVYHQLYQNIFDKSRQIVTKKLQMRKTCAFSDWSIIWLCVD